MRWTKLKQLIEQRFAPDAKGRVEVQTTRYRQAHDDEGEFWLTLDGEKIYGSSFYQLLKERRAIGAEGDPITPESLVELEERGFSDQHALQRALFASLSQSVDEMLTSHHPLVRALAVLDTRCGMRRLAKIDPDTEHPMVSQMHRVRLSKSSV